MLLYKIKKIKFRRFNNININKSEIMKIIIKFKMIKINQCRIK